MRKNFHSKSVSEVPPSSPRKALPNIPTGSNNNNNYLTISTTSTKPLPSSPRVQTPSQPQQSFVTINTDEDELLSLLSMEGAKVFVIGLWDEMSPLLSNNSLSLSNNNNNNNGNNNTTTTTTTTTTTSTTNITTQGSGKKVPPPIPPKSSSFFYANNNNRRLSKIIHDTTCFISEDGKALVCESDLPQSSGPMGMQKRSNIILFSEVEKIVPYYQSETLIGNVSDKTNIPSPRQSINNLSNPYQITHQDARECLSFFERYFISGYDNNDREFQKSILPFKFQLFILKRKNHKKTLGFILEDPMQASTWIKGLQMVSDDSRGILSASSTLSKLNNVNNQKIDEEKRISFGKKVAQTIEQPMIDNNNSSSNSNSSNSSSRHLPPPLKINNRMESPINNTDVNNELAKQLHKLKRATPATPTSSNTSSSTGGTAGNSSNSNSRHSSLESLNNIKPETSAEKELFEVVVVVKLKKAEKKLEPFIDYEFPPQNVRSTKDLKLVMSIPLFCFPDIDTVKEETSLSGGNKKTYSFVLTEIDGTRKYGYCRRMLPKGSGKRLPETYCIISSHSCFGLFSTILDNIEMRNEINNVACFTFLKSVLANPFPSPGTCTIVKTVNPKTGQQEEVKLSRPILADPMLEYINFNILFESLSADNIITMFAFLLFERRMVIFSNDISKLSAFCQAMISILYPFTWQHVFIPVLPQSLVDYVCSPVPFVIGVLSNHKPYIEELKKDGQVETEVLYIDIDSGKVTEPPTLKDQKKILPKNKDLIKKMTAIGKEIKNSKNSNQVAMAKDTFVMFFVRLFGDYKAFIKPNPDANSDKKKKETPDWIFDTTTFLDYKKRNNKKKYEKFFINFVQCQMFERWSAEIANESQNKSTTDKELGLFEQLSAIVQQQILLDGKKK